VGRAQLHLRPPRLCDGERPAHHRGAPWCRGDRRRTPRAWSVAEGDVAQGGAGELVEPPGVAEEARRDTTRATRSRSRCCRSIMIASASASICARKCAELFTCCLQSCENVCDVIA
jgi:hypothetical protein